ncbi:hypothetical protein V1477_011875 [Vespula maculifrons]|uniref:C2H2-type domain-containing protein n=1 Tax=Vespula maculifrons TaxID=7453 RepID=A0ABD2C0G5_VESMC
MGSSVMKLLRRKNSGIDSRQEYSSLQPDYFIQNRERFERYQRQKGGYPCHKCGNHFTWRNNLYNHLKFQCGQLPRFNCPYCSYQNSTTYLDNNAMGDNKLAAIINGKYFKDFYLKQAKKCPNNCGRKN